MTTLAQMPGSWHHEGLFVGMHWLWWLFWILVMVVVVWAFVRLARDERSRRDRASEREAAEEALRRRFAEGEIGEDEFLHRMRLLRESRPDDRGEAGEG